MTPRTSAPARHALLVSGLILLAAAALTLGNLQLTRSSPGGTDFLYRWLPVRLVLVEGYADPYSPEVEYQVELMHYGRARQGNELPGIFAYPYYITPLYIPFALIADYALARALWMTLLETVILASVFLTIRLLGLKPRPSLLIALLLFALFFPYFTQALVDGNPSPLAAFFVLVSLYFISRNRDWPGGVFLALAAIKPQLVLLVFVLVGLWALSNRRWKLLASTALTLALLLGGAFAFHPGWLTGFLADLSVYPSIDVPYSVRTILDGWLPQAAGWIALLVSLVVGIVLLKEFAGVWRKGFMALFWAVCLTFALAPLSGLNSAHSAYIAALPGIIWLMDALEKRHPRGLLPEGILLAGVVAGWILFILGRQVSLGDMQAYYLTFFLPPPFLAAGLYWLKRKTAPTS